MNRILVVDDDEKSRALLTRYLQEEGFRVTALPDGSEVDAHLTGTDLIVLDLMLPGEDGLSIARRIRAGSRIPIIILSARGDDVDRIVGLEVGADDYLAKPFNPRELLARVRAVLRRSPTVSRPPDEQRGDDSYRFGDFVLDPATATLSRNGARVQLTPGEYGLLEIFVKHPNQVLSRDRLVDLIKGYDRSPFDRSIDVRVTRLRRKLETDTAQTRFIRTVWGKGYMFTPQGEKNAE